MPLLVLVVLFIGVPIAELFVIIKVGEAIGVFPTLAILIADSVLGSVLLRSQGRAAWRRLGEALTARRPPAREVMDGALIVFGGALLITPGFLSDLLGLLLLLPPSRAVVRRLLARHLTSRLFVGVAGMRGGRRPGGRGRGYDVEGSATDVDAPRRPLR